MKLFGALGLGAFEALGGESPTSKVFRTPVENINSAKYSDCW